MEISARVLREVEFNSSLRGYNTDEVDEFLETVADAVDRLHEEVKAAGERAEAAERGARDRTGLEDEESIRRTLVLAQRTADLAIREAQEEAGQILDRARNEAETLVGDARDSAVRLTSEAEKRLREEVARLSGARDGLTKEVDTLVSLLGAERERLTETLGAALRYVERSLNPSPELLSLQPSAARPGTDTPAGTDDSDASGERPSAGTDGSDAAEAVSTSASADDEHEDESQAAVVAPPANGESAAKEEPAKANGTDSQQPDVDDLEAAIAEDAAKAAPSYARQSEPEQYDWDSVIRGRPEPLFPDRGRAERPNLTALPSMEDSSQDTAAMRTRSHGADWPA